ncbi:MAG: glycine zipper 2TM domain-containing protein [Magnetococcales bacterium]|nr:glycine zipper 2TM domain-containing protein [Magnetococcales bacterium]
MKHRMMAMALTGYLLSPVHLWADAGGGAGVGALGGALAGSLSGPGKNRAENALIGAFAGGLLGYAIGNEREKEGSAAMYQALEYSPSYTRTTWVNPDTSVAYIVTPQPARTIDGRVCREVNLQATIDGQQETLIGLTCRDEYGQWRLEERNRQPAVTMVPTVTQTVVVTRPVTRYVVREPVYYPSSGIVIYKDGGRRHHHRDARHYDRHGDRHGWR